MRKIIFLSSILLISCDQLSKNSAEQKNTNIIQKYYDNGNIKWEIGIDNDKKRHGISRNYNSDKSLKSEIVYNHGKKEKATQFIKMGIQPWKFTTNLNNRS